MKIQYRRINVSECGMPAEVYGADGSRLRKAAHSKYFNLKLMIKCLYMIFAAYISVRNIKLRDC